MTGLDRLYSFPSEFCCENGTPLDRRRLNVWIAISVLPVEEGAPRPSRLEEVFCR